MRTDLSVNNRDIESLSMEILFDKRCDTLFNVLYRPPSGPTEPCEIFLEDALSKTKDSSKMFNIAGDFNINLLDYYKSTRLCESDISK